MPPVTALPEEILARIASFLIPQKLQTTTPDQDQIEDTCMRKVDLRNLRQVSRLWHRCTDAAMSTCASFRYNRALRYTPDEFRAMYNRLPCPGNVDHLHLGTHKVHLQYIDLYLSAFPMVRTLEIGEWDSRRWHELAKALAFAPHVNKIIWSFERWGLLRTRDIPRRPSATDRPLRQVKTLVLHNAGPVHYLDSFLEWFPELQSLWLNLGSCGMQEAAFGRALRHCRSSLKSLTIDRWTMYGLGPYFADGTADLTHMEALEEFSVRFVDANNGCITTLEWKLPRTVTKLYDYGVNIPPRRLRKALVHDKDMREHVDYFLQVAPGLKERRVQLLHTQMSYPEDWAKGWIRLWNCFDERGIRLVIEPDFGWKPALFNPTDIRRFAMGKG